ncbi:hypothetical protein EJ04DRAFT_512712 [Polyplosphaeria fusca]|uniref:Uncharacterized protein n=1 Tax=Polyplosphaeria fusca TaxID=682080 RepID=A0A9P4QUE6_9PLEO|nr:hypothetical protein EJ04DRAFT_512712 [Polyplosphaeria fusca]
MASVMHSVGGCCNTPFLEEFSCLDKDTTSLLSRAKTVCIIFFKSRSDRSTCAQCSGFAKAGRRCHQRTSCTRVTLLSCLHVISAQVGRNCRLKGMASDRRLDKSFQKMGKLVLRRALAFAWGRLKRGRCPASLGSLHIPVTLSTRITKFTDYPEQALPYNAVQAGCAELGLMGGGRRPASPRFQPAGTGS